MFDTDEVAVGRLGIRLNPGQFWALGLREGSRAWGLWVEGRGGREKMSMPEERGEEFDPNKQGPHLVVSTIHPDLWPAAMRIEARLCREQWALENFLTELARMGVNVLSLDTAIRGYNLMVVELFVNVPRLSDMIRGLLDSMDKDVAGCDSTDEGVELRRMIRRCVFKEIGERVLSCAAVIEAKLRIEDAQRHVNQDSTAAYFHRSSRSLGHQPWFLPSWGVPTPARASLYARAAGLLDPGEGCNRDYTSVLEETSRHLRNERRAGSGMPDQDAGVNEDWYAADRVGDEHAEMMIERLWRDHAKPAVMVRALPTLAYARVWRAHEVKESTAQAMEIVEFEARGGLLECTGGTPDEEDEVGLLQSQMRRMTRSEEPESLWLGRWTAFASFHHAERSMRFRMLRPWFSRRYAWQIEAPYLIRLHGNGPSRQGLPRSSGLLKILVEEILRESGIRIEQLTNTLTRLTTEEEWGRIRMVVIPAKANVPLDQIKVVNMLFPQDFHRRVESGFKYAMRVFKDEGIEIGIGAGGVRIMSLHDLLERAW